MGMEHYVKVRELGGSNGAFLGYDKQDRERKVVIKRLTSGAQGMEELSALLRVQSFRHEAQIYESFVYRSHLYIVMRYYDGGDLEDKFNELRCRELLRQGGNSENEQHDKYNTTNMKNKINLEDIEKKNVSSNINNNNTLEGNIQLANAETLSLENLRLRLHWAEMIVKAVKCCHEQHIVHRDIKPGNIFVAYNKQQKIIHKSKKSHEQEREEEQYREMESDYSNESENYKISQTKLQQTEEWPSSPSLSSSSSLSSLEQSLESSESRTSTSYSKAKNFQQKESSQYCLNSRLNNSENNNVNNRHKTDREVQLYLGDFGSAKALQSSSLTSTFVGSPLWLAPEVLEGMSYGMPSDIWSLGCVLYEMFTLQRPFHATSFVQLVESVTHGKMAHSLPDTLPHELCTLIMRMLSVNPSTRPSAVEVLHVIRELYHSVSEQMKRNMPCKENNAEEIKHQEMMHHNDIIRNESDNDVNTYKNDDNTNSTLDKKEKRSITASKTGRVAEIADIDERQQYSYVHSSPSSECIVNEKSNTTNNSKSEKNINCERQSLEDNNKNQQELLNKQNLQHQVKVPLRSVCSFPVISTSSSSSTSKWHTKKCNSNVCSSSSYIAMSDNHDINNNIHISDKSENDNDVARRRNTGNKKITNNTEDTSSKVSVVSIQSLSRCVQETNKSPATSTSINSSQVAHHLNKSQESTLIAVHTNNNSECKSNSNSSSVVRTYVNSDKGSNVKSHNKISLLPAIKTRSNTCAKPGTSSSSLFSAPTLITVDTNDFALFDSEESHQGHTLTHVNEHQSNTKLHNIVFNKGNTHNYESISQAVKLEMLDNVTQTAPVIMLRADNYTNNTSINNKKEEKNNSENKVNKSFRANNICHPNNINNQKSKLMNRSNDSMSTKVDGNSNNNDNCNTIINCCNSEEKLIDKEYKETSIQSRKAQESTKAVPSDSAVAVLAGAMSKDINVEQDQEMSNKPKEKLTSLSLLARLSRQTTSSSHKMKNSNLSNESVCNEEVNEDKVKNDEEVDKTCKGPNTDANVATNNNNSNNINNNSNSKSTKHNNYQININMNNKVWKVKKAPPPVKLAPIRHGPATSTSSCSSHSSLMINNSTTNNNTSSSNIKQSSSELINNTGQEQCINETMMTHEPFLLEEEPQRVGVHKTKQWPRKSLDNKFIDITNNTNCGAIGDVICKYNDNAKEEENISKSDVNHFVDCIECGMESKGTEAKSVQIVHNTNTNNKIINEELSSSSSSSSSSESCTSSHLDTLSNSNEDNTIKNTQPPQISHLPETKNAIKNLETASLSTLSSASTSHRRISLHDKTDNRDSNKKKNSEEEVKIGNLTSSTNDETREDTWLIRQQQELEDIEHYLMSHEAHDNNVLQGYGKPQRSLRNAHKNMHRNSGKEIANIINDDDNDFDKGDVDNNSEFYSENNTSKDEEEKEDDDEEDNMWYYNLHTKSKTTNGQYANNIQNKYQEIETSWQLNLVRISNEANRKSPSCTWNNHSPSVDNNNNNSNTNNVVNRAYNLHPTSLTSAGAAIVKELPSSSSSSSSSLLKQGRQSRLQSVQQHYYDNDNNYYNNKIRSKEKYKSSSPEKQYQQHQRHNTRRIQRSHEVYHHTQRQASEARGHKILTQEEEEEANRQRAEARVRREAERLNMVKMINERRIKAKRERQEKELRQREEPLQRAINSSNGKEEKEEEQDCKNHRSVAITTSSRLANANYDNNKNFSNHDKHEQSNLVNYVVTSKKKTHKDEQPCNKHTNSRQEGKDKLRKKPDVKVEIRLPDNLRYTE